MEEQAKVPVFKGSLMYGLIVGIVLVIFSLLLYFTDQSFSKWARWATSIIYLVLLVGSLILFRKEYGKGFATYGQLILVSLIVGFVSTFLSATLTFALYEADPSYLQDTKYNAIEMIDERMEKMDAKYQERLSDAQYDQFEERMKRQRKVSVDKLESRSAFRLSYSSVFGATIFSVIIGLIAAIFIRKNPDPTH